MLSKGTEFKATNEDGIVTEWVVIHQSDSAAYLMALPRNDPNFAQATDKDAEFSLTPDMTLPTFFNYREVLAVRLKSDEPWQENWQEIPEMPMIKHGQQVGIIKPGPVL